MELFFSEKTGAGKCLLGPEESNHCVRVLRHREGDVINVIDGKGTLYECRIENASPKETEALIINSFPDWGGHPYRLVAACCPTKNNDRFEWFVEKAVEFGVDAIVPLIGDRSERKVYKTDRASRIALSAVKQSLKATVPEIMEPVSVKDFLNRPRSEGSLGLIACCFETENQPRRSIKEVLGSYEGREITVLTGPEGDFSPEEVELAVRKGFIPVSLGDSRLRTETAAVASVAAVYFRYLEG